MMNVLLSSLKKAGKMKLSLYRDKVAGAFYGFCIGDAMGATTEFMDEQQIFSKYGEVRDIIGGGWLALKAGEVTDDSQMMFCIIDALEEVGVDCSTQKFKHAVAKKFEAWFATDPVDIGSTCASGITYYALSNHRSFIKRNDDLLGNGGLMRFLPLALLDMIDWNIAQNDITHYSEGSARAIQRSQEVVKGGLTDGYIGYLPNDLQRPLGTCGNTLNNALWFQKCPTFKDAIIQAVNMGGDSDTIAAIIGGMYGARIGLEAISKHCGRWISQLDVNVKMRIGHATNVIVELAQKVHPEWFTNTDR